MSILGLVTAARTTLPRVVPLFRNPAVPAVLKVATVVLAILIVSPLDLLSDIPILGLFDDAALLAMLASGFVAIASRLLERMAVPVLVRNTTARPTPLRGR